MIHFFVGDKRGCKRCVEKVDDSKIDYLAIHLILAFAMSLCVSSLIIFVYSVIHSHYYNDLWEGIKTSYNPWFYSATFIAFYIVWSCMFREYTFGRYYYAFWTKDGVFHVHAENPLKNLGSGEYRGWFPIYQPDKIGGADGKRIVHGKVLRILDRGYLPRLLRVRGDKVLSDNKADWRFSHSHEFWRLKLRDRHNAELSFVTWEQALIIINTFVNVEDYRKAFTRTEQEFRSFARICRAVHLYLTGTKSRRPGPVAERARSLIELALAEFGKSIPADPEADIKGCLEELERSLDEEEKSETPAMSDATV